MDENCGIYEILNLANGKRYLGSSTDLTRRQIDHFRKLENQTHDNIHLQRSYNKHGNDSFRFIVVEYTEEDNRFDREQHYLDTLNPKYLYNISKKAYGARLFGEDNGFYGKTHSDETKEKLRQINMGKRPSEKTKALLREVQRGEKNGNYGNKWSDEMKLKASIQQGIPIIIEGIEYTSARAAARILNIEKGRILYRLKSQSFENYQYKNECDKQEYPVKQKRYKVCIYGVIYKSINQAAKAINLTSTPIKKRLDDENNLDFLYCV